MVKMEQADIRKKMECNEEMEGKCKVWGGGEEKYKNENLTV